MPAGEVFDLLARLREQTAVQDGRATLLAFNMRSPQSRRSRYIYIYLYGIAAVGAASDTGYL